MCERGRDRGEPTNIQVEDLLLGIHASVLTAHLLQGQEEDC